MDAIGREIYDIEESIFTFQQKKQFPELVEKMIKLIEKVKELRTKSSLATGSETKVDDIQNSAMATISERVQDIQINNQDLFSFAFNLRKQDTSNRYTRMFLEGNIKSTILIEIFCANVWRDQEQFKEAKMEMLPNISFKM